MRLSALGKSTYGLPWRLDLMNMAPRTEQNWALLANEGGAWLADAIRTAAIFQRLWAEIGHERTLPVTFEFRD